MLSFILATYYANLNSATVQISVEIKKDSNTVATINETANISDLQILADTASRVSWEKQDVLDYINTLYGLPSTVSVVFPT